MAKRRFRAQVHYFSFSFFCRFCKPRIQISRRHLFYSVECRINFLLLLISGKNGENQCFLSRDSCTTLISFFPCFFVTNACYVPLFSQKTLDFFNWLYLPQIPCKFISKAKHNRSACGLPPPPLFFRLTGAISSPLSSSSLFYLPRFPFSRKREK